MGNGVLRVGSAPFYSQLRMLADFHVRFRLEYLEPPAMLSGAPVGKLLARDGEGSGHILPPVLLVLDHAHRAILGRSVGHLVARLLQKCLSSLS